ncbi:hypothetical protein CKO28_02925 [Rhodovibrio sodomensis]|uniref:GGDEF domain-containing protein n=1 Tax=Rhodovibrio sodomensis TaxID=1088 RepID=A0ABS1DAR7_9PROT|nr:hypothetical protein [Rhodovibrio sodomensis]MBK1666996.1 hypothetical protein [Rhodovibrio sodomensis]
MTPLSKLLSNLDAKRALGSASFFLMLLVASHALAFLLSGGIASIDVSTARVLVALLMLLLV